VSKFLNIKKQYNESQHYIVILFSSQQMNIIVDVREHSLIEKLNSLCEDPTGRSVERLVSTAKPSSACLKMTYVSHPTACAETQYETTRASYLMAPPSSLRRGLPLHLTGSRPMQSLRDPEQPPVIPTTNAKVKITTEQLLIGDVLLRTDDQKEIILFERKSLQDLLASIKDGRYKEQSHRLTHTSGLNPHHIVYIIEGVLSTLMPQDKKIVLSAIASLSYFKGFSVFRTATVLETAEQILAMATKIQKEFEGGAVIPVIHSVIPSSQEPGLETPEGNVERTVALSEEHVPYSSFVKKAKKDNITPENIGEILLCQIPGISSTIAVEVLRNFDGSFCRLIDEIRTHPEKLDTIYLESAGGKKRKLSSSVIAAIKTYLVK